MTTKRVRGRAKLPEKTRVYIAMDPETGELFPGWFTSGQKAKEAHGAWTIAKIFLWEGLTRLGGN